MLTNLGYVYTVGSSHFGQLGHSNFDMLTNFTKVNNLPPNVVYISAGGNHTWAIADAVAFEKLKYQPPNQ